MASRGDFLIFELLHDDLRQHDMDWASYSLQERKQVAMFDGWSFGDEAGGPT
jgi:hypothetical protein